TNEDGGGIAMDVQDDEDSDARKRKEPRKETKDAKRKPAKKKRNATQPPISNLIQPYSIVTIVRLFRGSLFKNSRRISKSFDEADVDMFSDLLVKN
ncbi:15246_t:CDS:1, partial [Entrophospora sp. SA101]